MRIFSRFGTKLSLKASFQSPFPTVVLFFLMTCALMPSWKYPKQGMRNVRLPPPRWIHKWHFDEFMDVYDPAHHLKQGDTYKQLPKRHSKESLSTLYLQMHGSIFARFVLASLTGATEIPARFPAFLLLTRPEREQQGRSPGNRETKTTFISIANRAQGPASRLVLVVPLFLIWISSCYRCFFIPCCFVGGTRMASSSSFRKALLCVCTWVESAKGLLCNER